ncbi:bile acid:sodium symporter family protein [Cytobacillus kochii]|uniref:bile acid:sodium symporter family protein n=1 Tax=Cytobacillus kochii TaxID=859143 RepID=UPI00203BADE0|nr:bile acid:sodium symporter [Cytobacillus kochii]MCM3323560.1 bile acid:sodium symporter [Cytobacillus kochii]MCM3345955.1 bile acid:sodium symporter [Cytobacillus kochii]
MKWLTEFLSKRLPVLILLISVITYFSSYYLKVPSWIPSLLLGIVIFFTGLSMELDVIKGIRRKKRELFMASFLKWTITVFISIGMAYLFFSSKPEIAAGFILSGTVPSATAATLYTFLAGGNTSLVIVSTLIDVAISPIVTPLSLFGITDASVTISFFDLLKSFLLIVVLPLSAGIVIQRSFPDSKYHAKSATKFGSSLALLLTVHIIVGNGRESIQQEISILPILCLAIFIQVVFPMIASYFISKKLSISEEDSRAILFQVGLCNSALAAILAFDFIGELAAIAPIINMIINLSVGSWISNYFARKNIVKVIEIRQNAEAIK